MVTASEQRVSDLAARNYLKRSVGKGLVKTLTSEGHPREYAESFAKDLFFVEWSECGSDEDEKLAFRLLGFDFDAWQDFNDRQRLEDGLSVLLGHEGTTLEMAQRITKFYFERVPNANLANLVAEIIEELLGLYLDSDESVQLLTEFWQAHGMGHVPYKLYPYYSEKGPIYKASLAAVRAGLRSADEHMTRIGITAEAAILAHEIYATLLWVEGNPIDIVEDTIALSYFGSESISIFEKRQHKAAALQAYWKTLGIDINSEGTPLFY